MNIDEIINDQQKDVLRKQMFDYLGKKIGKTEIRYGEFCTLHKVNVPGYFPIFFVNEWIYFDKDLFITVLEPITELEYNGFRNPIKN